MPSLADYKSNYLTVGEHETHVTTFKCFSANSGTSGVEFTVQDAFGSSSKATFFITEKAMNRLASFARACGLSEDEMRAYDPFNPNCHAALQGRAVCVTVDKREEKYHEVVDWKRSTLPAAKRTVSKSAPVAPPIPSDIPTEGDGIPF